MKVLDIFTKEKQEPIKKKLGHNFTDTEREYAKIKRNSALNFKRKVKSMKEEILLLELQQQKVLKLKEIKEIGLPTDDYDDDDYDYLDEEDEEPEDMDTKLFSLFEKVLSKPQLPQIQTQNTQFEQFNALEMVNKIPMNIRSELKKKTPDEIRALANLYYPDLDKAQLEQIIPLL